MNFKKKAFPLVGLAIAVVAMVSSAGAGNTKHSRVQLATRSVAASIQCWAARSNVFVNAEVKDRTSP